MAAIIVPNKKIFFISLNFLGTLSRRVNKYSYHFTFHFSLLKRQYGTDAVSLVLVAALGLAVFEADVPGVGGALLGR